MSQRRHAGRLALAAISTMALVACSSGTPTSPTAVSLTLTATAPTIALTVPYYLRSLCYPARAYSTRGCPSGGSVTISNSGGGTLNWTSSSSAPAD